MDYKEIFSNRLITLREEREITQQELADELGITRQSLSLYEKAERTINIELLAKIADFFSVSTDYLMGRTDKATLEESIQTTCKTTGLTEQAVLSILNANNSYGMTYILNHILETKSELLYPVLTNLYLAGNTKNTENTQAFSMNFRKVNAITNEEYAELQRMRLNKAFEKLADDVIQRLREDKENG